MKRKKDRKRRKEKEVLSAGCAGSEARCYAFALIMFQCFEELFLNPLKFISSSINLLRVCLDDCFVSVHCAMVIAFEARPF